MRLAVLSSHPIQYHAPLFRELAKRLDLKVFFAHRASAGDQAAAGFGVGFQWDVDLLSGFEHCFLKNIAGQPGLDHFAGCDTPLIREALSEGLFDALLVMGWHLKSYWQGIWAAKRLGLPVMVRGDSQLETPRSVFKKLAKSFVYPTALRQFDAALYVGERSRRYWVHYGFPLDRLVFSPHCIDNNWFAARATKDAGRRLRDENGIPPKAKVALFAGKVVPFKRPMDLVAAVAAASSSIPNLTLLVAGAGTLSNEMSAAAGDQGVSLVHLGFCNQTKMPSAYAAADVLVLPSDGRETWGLVANEALACGRPIIISDACGCAPDLAEDGTVGRVFPVGDVQSLSRAISELACAPPAPSAIAAKAERYSVAAAAEGVSVGLTRIVTRRRTVA